MKRNQRIGILIIGFISLMILVNLSSYVIADETTPLYFSDWTVNDNDYFNLKEYDAQDENDFKHQYQLVDVYGATCINNEQLAININAPTTYTNYGFSQQYLELDNDSFKTTNGLYSDSGLLLDNNYTTILNVNGQDVWNWDTGSYADIDNSNEFDCYPYVESYGSSGSDKAWAVSGVGSQTNFTFTTTDDFTEIYKISVYMMGCNSWIMGYTYWYQFNLNLFVDGFWKLDSTVHTAGGYELALPDPPYTVYDYVPEWFVKEFYFSTPITNLDDLEIGFITQCDLALYYCDYIYVEVEGQGNFNDIWIDNSGSGCSIELANDYNAHSNVIHLDDDSTSLCLAETSLNSNIGFGTLEFYWLVQDCTPDQYIQFYDGATRGFYLYIETDKIYARDGAGATIIKNPIQDETWYHIKIDFECTTNRYRSLSQYDYNVYVDGLLLGVYDFENVVSFIDTIELYSHTTYTTDSYYDAFSFCWLTTYDENDNFQDYENNVNAYQNVEMNYRYYDESNNIQKRINLNASISENDFTYELCEQDYLINDFRHQKIIQGYDNQLDGNYYGTYSFENDINYLLPLDFIDSSGSGCFATKEKAHLKHNDILQLRDQSSGALAKCYNDFYDQESGTIEFYVSISDTTKDCPIGFFDSGSWLFSVGFYSDTFSYYDGGWITLLNDVESNRWYHIRIDFESGSGGYQGLSADTYDCYIDGVLFSDLNYENSGAHLSRLQVETNIADATYLVYFDAIGYSWDENYDIADNLICGIWENDNLNIQINTFEIQIHSYVGLNNLSIESINIEVVIRINDNNSLVFRKYFTILYDYQYPTIKLGLESCKYFRKFPNTYRNVFHNDLKGARVLYDSELSREYSHFVDFGYFFDDLDLIIPVPPPSESSSFYWLYDSYELQFSSNETWYFDSTIEGNDDFTGTQLNFTYSLLEIKARTNRFYYYQFVNDHSTNWGLFEWLRLGLMWIVNVIILIPIQFVMYMVVVAFNFIIMFLIIGLIAVFFWNFVIKYLVYAVLWLIVWLLPLIEWALSWILYIFLPLLTQILIIVFSVVFASILWLISFGQADFELLLQICADFFELIGNTVLQIFTKVVEYLPYFLLYASTFVILIAIGYIKLLYCKSKGYNKRVKQLEQSIQAYLYPINQIRKIAKGVKDSVPLI